jgi:hypothetical protein
MLAACGGGGDGVDAVDAVDGGGGGDTGAPVQMDDTVPASAIASPRALAQYIAALHEDDRREPLNVAGLVLPTSETAEPAAVAR